MMRIFISSVSPLLSSKAFQQTQKIALVLVLLSVSFPLPAHTEERTISLNGGGSGNAEFNVSQNEDVRFNNDFDTPLIDMAVIQIKADKTILLVKKFMPGQSINLAFAKAGSYRVCYSASGPPDATQACITLNVVKLQPA